MGHSKFIGFWERSLKSIYVQQVACGGNFFSRLFGFRGFYVFKTGQKAERANRPRWKGTSCELKRITVTKPNMQAELKRIYVCHHFEHDTPLVGNARHRPSFGLSPNHWSSVNGFLQKVTKLMRSNLSGLSINCETDVTRSTSKEPG